jgi:putative tryptophan/tyrosine transport system substrate-binding protein
VFGMRRRQFITLAGGAVMAWPLAARAQARRPLVGYLAGAAPASVMRSTTALAFVNGLREQGYVEGRDLEIAYKFAEGFLDRLPALAEQLVKLGPDAILAPTTFSAVAAKAASPTVPIVCPLLENPVRVGLVASENQPGGNVTGLLRYVDGLAGKQVELARELIPGVARIGVLINSGNSDLTGWRDVEIAGSALAIEVLPFEVGAPNDLDAAFAKIAGARVEAIVVLADPMFFSERRRIIISATAARLPTIWSTRIFAEDDGLLSYGIDEADSFRRAAGYVAKILKGAKAGELPVELPVKFELLINLRTAKALGLDVPAALLARADEVIE